MSAFKGIIGNRPATPAERQARRIRAARKRAEHTTGARLSGEAAAAQLAVGSLGKLCRPSEIEKRRTRKIKHSPGRYGIRSELADTPIGRR